MNGEGVFVVIVAQGSEFGLCEVPNLVALGWSVAGEHIGLVIAIEMNFDCGDSERTFCERLH